MRDATDSKVAVARFFPLWCVYRGRAGQSVTAARGTVGHPARQVRADTFRICRYFVDRSPRRISRKGICRDQIGDMLDSYPCYTLVYPCRAVPWEQPLADLSSFLVQQRTMQSNKVTFCTTIQYNTQSKSTDGVKDGTMQTIEHTDYSLLRLLRPSKISSLP